MKREIIKDLLKWKESSNRKPLIIRGARQVGKTWLMKEFGKECYEKCAYINFDDKIMLHTHLLYKLLKSDRLVLLPIYKLLLFYSWP